MTLDTFLVRLPFEAGGWSASMGNLLLSELLSDDGGDRVLSGWSDLEREVLRLSLLIEAEDARSAELVVQELLEGVRARSDSGLPLEPWSTTPASMHAGRLALASDLDGMVEALEAAVEREDRRPPVRLLRQVRAALGSGLLERLGDPDGIGVRVRLGRVRSWDEPRPIGQLPWRTRPGASVGLPSTTELATLAGVAFDVEDPDPESLAVALGAALEGQGWVAALLGEEIEEWLGRPRFLSAFGPGQGRTWIGLFPLRDPLDLVWFHGTTAAEVGVGTDELVGYLRAWRSEFGLRPVRVGPTGMLLRAPGPPPSPLAFAAEVLGVCPRAGAGFDPGDLQTPVGRLAIGSFQELAEAVVRTGRLTLDWS